MVTIDELTSRKTWIDICAGSPSYRVLSEQLKGYFPRLGVRENLADFMRMEIDPSCLALKARDKSRGYVFVGVGVPVQRGADRRMQELRDEYSSQYEIESSFTNFKDMVAGFSWRKSAEAD